MVNGSGIKAIDIMTGEVVIAQSSMTIAEAAKLMNSFRLGGVPVVDKGVVVGMLTERDIMTRVVATDLKPGELKVNQVMTSPPKVTVKLDEDMNSVAEKMVKYDVTRIPVLDKEGKLAGIVTNRDILRNSKELLDVLLEQAKVKAELTDDHTAFGKCQNCGQSTHLAFKDNAFVCDLCINSAKKTKRKLLDFKLFK